MRTVCKITQVVAMMAVIALAGACGDDDTGGNDNLDGSVDTGDATDVDADVVDADTDADLDATVTPDASPTDCMGLGTICTDAAECCSDRCLMNSGGDMVCQPGDGCKGPGEVCETAVQCCTMFCDSGVCAEGGICEPEGGACDEATDCCTNDCDVAQSECLDAASNCGTLGDICTSDSNCCSTRCDEVAPGDLRCLSIGPCATGDEVCASNSECCNNACVDGLCVKLTNSCTTVYEPCTGGGSCCSGICGDPGTGYPVCLYIGGCTPEDEICQTNEECCSFGVSTGASACEEDNGVMRCNGAQNCVADGDLCEFASSNHCCANEPGGPSHCLPTSIGVSRCFFSTTECIPTDGECSFSDECCDGVCAPDPQTGILVCNPSCIPEGDLCTTDADCCSGNCNTAGVCGPEEDPCVPLGGTCVVAEDCCDTTYLCVNETCAPYVP